MTGGKEKSFNSQVAVLKPRPQRPQNKMVPPRSTSSTLFTKDLSGKVDCCVSEEECNCFPWVQYNDFYAVSFSPPRRVTNPIVRDKRFLVDGADHSDTFAIIRNDRQDIFFYNTEAYSSSGEAELDYMIMFA
ncbi:uncharacterized protein Gasu_56100 [Galdieria sulphuraria]|uniref:Uncharacterized protein n=1 Tax=Galdieria sulphuraria TaxID=130081 RepID=M2VUG2_GALSU|nr:uncharacterized protein Gasu_56100 [Galdieria sulphuraria]EME26821.1 hypothetical protein Gasu_56100 [Galdieria sulphuraria]|eukprot:XP_005703341.1 hypothetical protein Gasu_56100 [Galdieria sulphuraria]